MRRCHVNKKENQNPNFRRACMCIYLPVEGEKRMEGGEKGEILITPEKVAW